MNNDARDLAADLLEVGLDQLIENEVLKEIPVIGSVIKVAKLSRSIPDLIFGKKVEKFALSTAHISDEQRRTFHAKLESEPELRRKAGEAIIMSLDHIDDLEKAAIVGHLFSKFVLGNFELVTLRRLLTAVDQVFLDDLLLFQKWASGNEWNIGLDRSSLAGTGLVYASYPVVTDDEPYSRTQTAEPEYQVSRLGQLFAECMSDYWPTEAATRGHHRSEF